MRVLVGYSWFSSRVDVRAFQESWLSRLRGNGLHADGFCLTVNPPAPCYYWPELERLWKRGDLELLKLYERLALRLQNYDVFLNLNGINIHPEFVRQLPTINVYACCDDPESSEILSRPVAAAYDLSLVANVAAVDLYKQWGVRNARFWPMGFREEDFDPQLTREAILDNVRDNELALLCERTTHWRSERLDRVVDAFPQGIYRGPGWASGFLPESERVPLLQRTKVGINMHNSTGPINSRTYYLPANGVMQICDNKSHLGKIYEIGREVVGFETVDEAIDLCRYYLSHEDERRQIAAAGWARAVRDYNEVSVFRLMTQYVAEISGQFNRNPQAIILGEYLDRHRRATSTLRLLENIACKLKRARDCVRPGIWKLRCKLGLAKDS